MRAAGAGRVAPADLAVRRLHAPGKHLDGNGACGALGVNTAVVPAVTDAMSAAILNAMGDTSIIPATTAVTPVDTFYFTVPQVP